MTDLNKSAWFIYAITGSHETVMDWRCIHDKDKGRPAHNYRGTLSEVANTLIRYNDEGYGIFVTVNATDGHGRELSNIDHVRAHFVDLDNALTAEVNFQRASSNGASFAVMSSPAKFHVYWRVAPYRGNEFFTLIQKKLRQLYDGDERVTDASRVMRVPGFFHHKNEPFMVECWPLPNFDRVRTYSEIEQELSNVNVVDFTTSRSPLGTFEMAAPSLEWLKFALSLVDPNEMDRGEWLLFSAAVKQSGWNHTDPDTLFEIWSNWCDRFVGNDPAENIKLWNSIRDTEVGWSSIEKRAPVKAYMTFGFKDAPPALPNNQNASSAPESRTLTIPDNAAGTTNTESDKFGEILSENECREWFRDCYFVAREGRIFSRHGRFMNATQFNGRYGGKQFIVTSTGKITDEPWKAALRSTLWTIPQVDHVRFLPDRPTFEIIDDGLGRKGLNTYIPAVVKSRPGDVSPWLNHVARVLPFESDRKIFFDYIAHCVKYPGYKIPWAVMLQSAEGIGKTVFFEVMQHALGDMYVYSPKAPELVKSGSTFNAWQRGKLLIVVNEIKIDERRELIEILKPMITDNRVEIQSKGVDQDMEDNPANWLFFSNYKDAIPISANGRRYAVFYSALQSKNDIFANGMDEQYFNRLWNWLRNEGGLEFVTHWLKNYPIEKGAIPVRAPETSSHDEALRISRSPLEIVISECIADGVAGFRNGFVSTLAVVAKARGAGIRNVNTRTAQSCLENMGYVHVGRAHRAYMQEDANNRAEIYANSSILRAEDYGRAQGYE